MASRKTRHALAQRTNYVIETIPIILEIGSERNSYFRYEIYAVPRTICLLGMTCRIVILDSIRDTSGDIIGLRWIAV